MTAREYAKKALTELLYLMNGETTYDRLAVIEIMQKYIRIARAEEFYRFAYALCGHCRDGVKVEKDQWGNWMHPQGASTRDGREMIYGVLCTVSALRDFEEV
jgi:hypothetical protein